ncbi:unnamed protein product [Orchesella dallaii]|uniref:EamA domain-containing protein n=1 Tax=Orchesella dallaii TaxID=48710 RepID=A0ABP1QE09_9HEXA
MESVAEEDIDPCTGFLTTNKARLSIPSIAWSKYGRSSITSISSPPLNPIDKEIQDRLISLDRLGWKRYVGLLLTVLSAITFSFNALIAKLLSHMHPFNLGVWTFQLMTLFAIPTIIYERKVNKNEAIFESLYPFHTKENRKAVMYLVIRAFCGVNALILFFYAVKYLTVADALVIDASSPIFVYVMASLLLGEKFGVLPIFITIMAFIGVALITRPPLLTNEVEYNLDNLIGVALAFSCMLCITFTIITLKFLENVFHGIVNLVFGLWGTLQCLLVSFLCGTLSIPTEWPDMWKIFATAVLFYLGQAFITLALKYEDAGPVGLLRSTEVIFCFVWQFLFLDVVPDIYR